MWLDAGVVLIVLLYALLGLFQGIIVQVFRLIGLVLVFFYIAFVAEPVGQWLAAHLDLNALAAYYVSLVAGTLILYAACSLLGRAIHKMAAKTEKPQTLDRVLGLALGALKGAVVAFLILCMCDMIPAARPPVAKLGASGPSWLQGQIRHSALVARVHPWNPLPELRFLADVEDYKKLLDDPKAMEIFQAQPAFANRLRNNAKFCMAVGDPGLRLMISRRQWPDVLANDKVLAMVFDRDVRKILNELRPKAALDEAARLRGQKSR